MTAILITDLTTGIVGGTGAFDELMKVVTAHLDLQYNSGRLKGSDYATVYLGSTQSAMAQAVQFVLGKQVADKQADLYAQKILSEEAQIKNTLADGTIIYVPPVGDPVDVTYVPSIGNGVIGKQQTLFKAQTDGFARDAEQKVLKVLSDAYAVRRSTDTNDAGPTGLNDTSITNMVDKAAKGVGIDNIDGV